MVGLDKTVGRLGVYVGILGVYKEIRILAVMVKTEILLVDSLHCTGRDDLQLICVELRRKWREMIPCII